MLRCNSGRYFTLNERRIYIDLPDSLVNEVEVHSKNVQVALTRWTQYTTNSASGYFVASGHNNWFRCAEVFSISLSTAYTYLQVVQSNKETSGLTKFQDGVVF